MGPFPGPGVAVDLHVPGDLADAPVDEELLRPDGAPGVAVPRPAARRGGRGHGGVGGWGMVTMVAKGSCYVTRI